MPVAAESRPKTSSTGLTPERTLDQRKRALDHANEIRSKRAKLKKDLKAGRVKLQTLILNPPDFLLTAKVWDMLLAVPKYGRVKANRVFKHCRVSPSKTFGGLSERQRGEIVAYMSR